MHRSGFAAQFFTFLLTLAIAVMPARAIAQPLQADPASLEALVLLNASTEAEMDAAIASIEAIGGMVFASFPNQGLFTLLEPHQVDLVQQMPLVRLLSVGPVSAEAAQNDEGARAAILSWNARLNPPQLNIAAASPHQDYPDALIPSDWESLQEERLLSPNAPGQTQTSEFMLRNVQVDVFLVESNGSIDTNRENWTTAMRDQVITEITNGVTWWAAAATQGGRPTANLSTNIVFHTPFNEPAVVATGYEPITRPHTDQSLWIGQIMTNLGYSGAYQDAVRRYDHDRRTANGRDWAFTIFVVNSLQDTDGMFSNGYFGYAYLFGPFIVMTYDNDNWTIINMEIVAAHEMGHIFGALDEYAASGCTDFQRGGYLNVANTNCENGDPASEDSIMRSAASQQIAYPTRLASTPVRGMLGWRDSDSDALYDPGDTIPSLSLTAFTPDPTNDNTPTWSGSVSDVPYISPTRTDVSINFITSIQYRIDGGAWASCIASDGAFNETEESYTCTPPPLSDGAHTIEVQARNRAGNPSTIRSDTVTIDATPPSVPTLTTPPDSSYTSDPTPTFEWTSTSDAVLWQIQVDDAPDYSSPEVSQTTATNSFTPSSALPLSTYSWRVRAQDAVGNWSNFSASYRFTLTSSAPPAAFGKSSPPNAAAGQPTSLVLSWQTTSPLIYFEYCYDRTNDNACSIWINNGAGTSVNLSGLSYGATYYWHVRAWNGNVGPTYANANSTAFWSFTIQPTATPTKVFLPLVAKH